MAIKKTIKEGIVHTYSDAGLKIQRKNSKFPVNNAFEKVGKEHEWEEVEAEPAVEEALLAAATRSTSTRRLGYLNVNGRRCWV